MRQLAQARSKQPGAHSRYRLASKTAEMKEMAHTGPAKIAALGHDRVLRMKAEQNREELSLWDVRKLQLYGRSRDSVQAATLSLVSQVASKIRVR